MQWSLDYENIILRDSEKKLRNTGYAIISSGF